MRSAGQEAFGLNEYAVPIHPTAIVDINAEIHDSALIGPYCTIGAKVHIGARTELKANLYIDGPTWIGEDNIFYPYSSIGVASQDKKYAGEYAETRIGNSNTIREFVTINRGTKGGGALTQIGNDNWIMAYVHIAHDAIVGNHCILGNSVTFAGHVTVEDYANIGAFSGLHQYCRVGRSAIIGGYSGAITQDVLPYSMTVAKREVKTFGANRIGMERRGISNESIEALQTALRLLTRGKLNTTQAIAKIREELPGSPELEQLLEFIRTAERGFVK